MTGKEYSYKQHLQRTKFHHLTLHVTKPYVLLANSQSFLYLYDYEKCDLIHCWSIRDVIKQKDDYIQWAKSNMDLFCGMNDRDLIGYLNQLNEQKLDASGFEGLKSIHLFDESIARFRVGSKNWSQDISKRLGMKASVRLPDKSKKGRSQEYVSDIVPISIVLQTEKRIVMIQYDEMSMARFRLREVKYSDFSQKPSITCMEFLSSHPLIAIGCADGSIRFWNYSTGKVIEEMTLRGHHQKAIVKIAVVHNKEQPDDDMLYSIFPTILTLSSEGTIVMWNLETLKADYLRVKSQDSASVFDMIVDESQGIVAILGHDKSVYIRNIKTGAEINKTKIDATKVSIQGIHCAYSLYGSGIGHPSSFILTTSGASKVFQISTMLDMSTWKEIPDLNKLTELQFSKKAKIYNIAIHPIHRNLLFCGTNFGLFIFKLDGANRMSIARGRFTSFGDSSKSSQRSIFYVNNNTVWKQIAKKNSLQVYDLSEPLNILKLNPPGPVRLHCSFSGRFLSVLWTENHSFSIYDLGNGRQDSPALLTSRENVSDICWCANTDRFAFIWKDVQGKQLEIYDILLSHDNITPIVEPILANCYSALCGKVSKLFGGHFIGVFYEGHEIENNKFHFIEWDGKKNVGDFLPPPKNVKCCELTRRILFIYDDSFAIFSNGSQAKMQSFVREKIIDALWWNGTLFILTATDLRCVFVGNAKNMTSVVVIASYDIGEIGIKSSAEVEEDSLDPIPQSLPTGLISLADVISDKLIVLDVFGKAYSLSLDHPSLKFRMLVCAGRVDQALKWLPYIPTDLHNYLAIFLCDRGYVKTAISELYQLRSSTKFRLCIENGYHKEAYHTLTEEIDLENVVLSEDIMATLYNRLAHVAEKNNDAEIAFKCFEKSYSLHNPDGYRGMIMHCVKYKKYEYLKQLEIDLQKLSEQDPQNVHVYNDILSTLYIMTRKHNKLQSIGLQQIQNRDFERWSHELRNKYSHAPAIVFTNS